MQGQTLVYLLAEKLNQQAVLKRFRHEGIRTDLLVQVSEEKKSGLKGRGWQRLGKVRRIEDRFDVIGRNDGVVIGQVF